MARAAQNFLYGFPNPLSKSFPPPVIAQRAPTTADVGYPDGQVWVDQAGDEIFFLLKIENGDAIWELAAGTGAHPITPYVVGPDGGYATIQEAIDAAGTDPAMIYIQPGTYTEDLVFVDGSNVELVSLNPYATTIVGVHTPPDTGFLTFLELSLQSASDILNSAAVGTAQLTFESCQVECTNGFTFNVASWTGTLQTFHSVHFGANNGVINNSGGSSVFISDSTIGAGGGQPMFTTGAVDIEQTDVGSLWTCFTGTVVNSLGCSYARTVTLASDATGSFVDGEFVTGATPAITMSSTGAVTLSNVTIDSSNDPVISGAGAGVFRLTDCIFVDGQNIAGTITNLTNSISRGGSYITQYTVGPAPDAQFRTVQAAVTAIGTTPAVLYVQPGTYTEDVTFVAGCNLEIVSLNPYAATITGVHVPPTSGFLTFLEIVLTSATHIFSSIAAGTAQITVESCGANCTNGFTFNLANWTGTLQTFHSVHGGTSNGFVTNSGGATLFVSDSTCGIGTGQTMVTTGPCNFDTTDFLCPWSPTTGSAITAFGCSFSRTLTLGGSASGNFYNGYWSTGATAAITMSSSGTVGIFNCSVTSSNNPAIAGAGAGVLTLANVALTSNAIVAATLTLAATQNNFLGGVRILSGTGSPDTSVTAQKGSLYMRLDGSGATDRAYINTDGSTAWTNLVTAG